MCPSFTWGTCSAHHLPDLPARYLCIKYPGSRGCFRTGRATFVLSILALGSVFAQRGHSANYYIVYPGNTPENHPLQKRA